MDDYLSINKQLWNAKTAVHLESEFYHLEDFLNGKSSLIGPEIDLLGDVKNKDILHLQCHFGQDSLSLARLGANVVGLDLSDEAIKAARALNTQLKLNAEFVCADVYSAPKQISKKFDIVFTTYGTIGWLPDLDKWAQVISHSLKEGGQLVFVDFHPMVWMYDYDFKKVDYSYFNLGPIIEENEGTYANREAKIKLQEIGWNHNLSEVLTALMHAGLTIRAFQEYDYSPYPCFNHLNKIAENKYQVKGMETKLPMLYSIVAQKLN